MGILARFHEVLIRGLAAAGGGIIALVCLIIAWDVIARNFGLRPPASTVALTEYALLYFTMATAPWLVRIRGHIVVEILYPRLPQATRRLADRAVPGLCSAICLLVAILATWLTIEAVATGEIEVRSMDTPRWALFLPLAVGFSLMFIEFARLLMLRESLFVSAAERDESL